ncbi:fructosamine kinase family protein [Nitrosomonas sp. HPC101]|uniref:fructosamine kinase family protein n=1 Tax=Nitrosomonas sp. HPC101 TaxID=1658667 RepID=UPI00136A2065|nr:fructosamine kinase family protein [Nitrosomonas sp. HPC101]MXS85412.1 fructosamine kinase family protein [Nitrosomonas sp. HPC101]
MKRTSLQTASPLWTTIVAQISQFTRSPFIPESLIPIGGGCINQTFCIRDCERRYCIKLNAASGLAMFEAEAAGLEAILDSASLRAPRPLCFGSNPDHAWLVLEFIDLHNRGNAAALGIGLANMHRHTAEAFGWVRDNTIGSTLQKNAVSSNWISFWRQYRLGYQLALARKNGYTGSLQSLGERLLSEFQHFFTDTPPPPSLLHGDLWGGNYAFDPDGQPVIFDPAVYYGDRETDLAMTELFGGFPPDFYAAYRDIWQVDAGYAARKQLYNLYHILNHLNLFGSQYLGQAETIMKKLLSELG